MSIACYKCSYPYCQGHTAPYMICVGSSANTFAGVATLPVPQLTEADVRRIVREELENIPPRPPRYTFSGEPSWTSHKAMQKVRPLTSHECQKLHEADTWCDLDSTFIAIMAARGIEVGE